MENITHLDFTHGPVEFLTSLLTAIGELAINIADVVAAVIGELVDITGLDFQNGPLGFITSLVDSILGFATQIEKIIQAVLIALVDVTGLDFMNGPEAFLASLVESIKHLILNIGEIITAIGNQIGISLANAEAFIEGLIINLFNIVGIDLTGPFNLAHQLWEFIEKLVHDAVAAILNFPGALVGGLVELQEWVLDTIFGIVPPDRIPVLPISHLINGTVNLLSNPSFTGSPFIPDQAGDWVLDAAVSQDDEGGSARIDANGKNHSLLSADLISVDPGQRLDISSWIKTENLAGALITIGVAEYNTKDGSDTPRYRVLTTCNQSGTSGWKKWSGIYVTPVDGVKNVRVHLEVGHATAGSVWFDNLFCGKMGLLQIDWVDGLGAWLNSIETAIASVLTTVADFLGFPEIVAELQKITGLVWDKGPIAFAQSIFDAVWHLIQAAITGITVTAEHVAEAVSNGISGFGAALYNALTGRPRPPDATPVGPQDAADQMSILVATITAQSTTITQLQAAIQIPDGGLIGGDDFERNDNSGLGPLWAVTTTGNGKFFLDGHEAVWDKPDLLEPGSLMPAHVKAIRAAAAADYHTKTAYQAITRVTGTRPLEAIPLFTSGTDEIYGRVSNDGQAYIVVVIAADRLFLRYNLGSGPDQELAAVAIDPISAATTFTLECGNSTKDFQYRVLRNSAVLINHDDNIAKKTAALLPNKGWGFGGAASGSLFGQVAPSSLHSVTVADLRSP